MRFNSWLRYLRTPYALIAAMVLAGVLTGCNEHRFTPQADIEVYPEVINYEIQRRVNTIEEVLITNKSVSAKLELFEVTFEDANGVALIDEDEQILDQAVVLGNLVDTSTTGAPITYTWYAQGVVSDVPCEDDSYCHCDPTIEGESACSYAVEAGTAMKERMGEMFLCESNPLDPEGGSKVCVAYFKYFNNAGNAQTAVWGGERERLDCTSETDCAAQGAEYTCLEDSKKCGTDIKVAFSLEYDLQQMVAVNTEGMDVDKAAQWKSLDGRALCLVDETGNVTKDVSFYGLNRCDQVALKQEVNKMDDGDYAVGFRLYPQNQANFRLMISAVEVGQAKYIAYCDAPNDKISMNSLVLEDPAADAACVTSGEEGAGEVDTDKLSIDPTLVRLDQLPVRVLYVPDSDYEGAKVLSGKSYTMRIHNSARVGGTYERTVSITVPESKGGPPVPIIELPADCQNPEPLDICHLEGRNSYSPFGEERKPFQYYWDWQAGGKPPRAQDAVLIASTGSFDAPVSIMGKWTAEGFPKIYFPIAGEYKIRLKVKDAAGVESGPNDECPTCKEWDQITIDVKPSEKLHVELTWDRGDYVDMDLYLVRYRPDGTYSVPRSLEDAVPVTPAVMPACTTSADCFDGAFECGGGGYCVNACDTDADCQAANQGWYCSTAKTCQEKDLIECNADEDCPSGFCNIGQTVQNESVMYCTVHDWDSLNDTCYYKNFYPRWGQYEDISMSCSGDVDCNGPTQDLFSCQSNQCLFNCSTSWDCLTKSDQYKCGAGNLCEENALTDDPAMGIDDVDGWGPENIYVEEPGTGKYRIIARFFSDPNRVISDASPNSTLKAYVQVYINGEAAFEKGLTHEFTESISYWKVADVTWDATIPDEDERGKADAVCAGWSQAVCETTEECQTWFDDEFACEQRQWGKFCAACSSGAGTPEECSPTIPCGSDSDCSTQATAKKCATIRGNYCRCGGVTEFGEFTDNPYANPFIWIGATIFDPKGAPGRSIWCDKSSDNYNGSDTCATLYGQ